MHAVHCDVSVNHHKSVDGYVRVTDVCAAAAKCVHVHVMSLAAKHCL